MNTVSLTVNKGEHVLVEESGMVPKMQVSSHERSESELMVEEGWWRGDSSSSSISISNGCGCGCWD